MIRAFGIPAFLANNVGLTAPKDILRGFGKLVVLAGPNGAGKTRYLNLLQGIVWLFRTKASELQRLEGSRTGLQSKLDHHQEDHFLAEPARTRKIEGLKSSILATTNRINEVKPQHVEADRLDKITFVHLTYDANKSAIRPFQSLTPHAAGELVSLTGHPGFTNAIEAIHAYFAAIAKALWNKNHAQANVYAEITAAAKDAELFNTLLDELVGGYIEPALDNFQNPVPHFRGRPFIPEQLSDGEAILITWAIILHQQKEGLENAIILIDEPENHLHPDACIKALTALRDRILGPHGQIWVATHAVQLVSFAGLDAVWLVDNGTIQYGGNQVDKVMNRLLGGREGRDRLRHFLSDADDLGFHKFAAECLINPTVAPHKEKDPQEAQFVQTIQQRLDDQKPLRVLDYGAGRGRLAKAMHEARSAQKDNGPLPSLEYHAYPGMDASADERNDCQKHVEELATGEGVRAVVVKDLREFELQAAQKMDLVVLCNVLHEISSSKWVSVFQEIQNVLAPTGTVLLMEDQQMSIGELPSVHGFIVLDKIELAALFNVAVGKGVEDKTNSKVPRLTLIEVRHEALGRISPPTVDDALNNVMKRAEREIERLRTNKDRDFKTGRLHAYFSMLYMNAKLALG